MNRSDLKAEDKKYVKKAYKTVPHIDIQLLMIYNEKHNDIKGEDITLKFNIGDVISADGIEYHVKGKIRYRNPSDGKCWDEYRLAPVDGSGEQWLSIDEAYNEYSISHKIYTSPGMSKYHIVDSGKEVVISCSGAVDVEFGDTAMFYEYEDATEEKIISREVWDDETEISEGYYLDKEEIFYVRHDSEFKVTKSSSGSGETGAVLLVIVAVIIMLFAQSIGDLIHFTPSIRKAIEKDSHFKYVTSITGEDNEKARVYSAGNTLTMDYIAKCIIDDIEGDTVAVQQDTEEEEGSIGILTKKEYCLVYRSEDGEILAQVSDRKYAYENDDQPYHSSHHVHHYYRRFYYSGGYDSDRTKYKKSSSPYSSYDGDRMSISTADTYSSYSRSVRQSSIHSRSSSGGGLSSGK